MTSDYPWPSNITSSAPKGPVLQLFLELHINHNHVTVYILAGKTFQMEVSHFQNIILLYWTFTEHGRSATRLSQW